MSVLIVDQNVAFIPQYCDRVYVLEDGRVSLWSGGALAGESANPSMLGSVLPSSEAGRGAR